MIIRALLHHVWFKRDQPEVRNALEFAFVQGRQGKVVAEGGRGHDQIVQADSLAHFFQVSPDFGVNAGFGYNQKIRFSRKFGISARIKKNSLEPLDEGASFGAGVATVAPWRETFWLRLPPRPSARDQGWQLLPMGATTTRTG